MRLQRRFLLCLAAVAAVVMVVQGVTGASEVVLYGGPFLLLVGMLLCGRFVGEDLILAVRRARGVKLRIALRLPRPAMRLRAPVSLLERSPRCLRGPPAPSFA